MKSANALISPAFYSSPFRYPGMQANNKRLIRRENEGVPGFRTALLVFMYHNIMNCVEAK
ncbi:MAG: hypothetical protein GX229_09800 [Syntrophomonadaceae bacterium]|nr:hypothetical protein [Syntrophomonadaceae bacterium]